VRRQHVPWTLLAASSALYFLSSSEADNDLWMHLFVGRRILESGAIPRVDDLSYTVAGAPWVDHEWLTHVLFAGVYDLCGSPGLLLLKLAVGLLASWCVWRQVAQHSEAAWVRGTVMVLTLSVLSRGFTVRPQIVTYLGVAWLLGWLDRRQVTPLFFPPCQGGIEGGARSPGMFGCGRKTALREWLEPSVVAAVFLLWGNAHGAFVAGLGILVLNAVVLPLRGRGWGLVIVAILAVCLNPYGPRLLGYLAGELTAPHPLTEWQPVALSDPAQWSFLFLLALLVGTAPFGRVLRQRPWWAVLVAAVAVMALLHQRHTPLFALCAAAPLAEQVEAAARWLGRRGLALSTAAVRALCVAAGLLAVVQLVSVGSRMAASRFRLVYEASEYPVGAVRFMREQGIRGNLALPLDWGGYVLWHNAPAVKVSIDGRFATVYPPAVVKTNFDFFYGGGAEAARLLDEYPTTLVLAPAGSMTPVGQRTDWHVLYRDAVAELFTQGPAGAVKVEPAPQGRLPFP
jgi:hypothetical protein